MRVRPTLNWESTGTMQEETDRRESVVATIRASCPTCGDVELTSRDVVVRVCAADDEGSYAFRCPSCRMAVAKRADPKIVDLLVSSGVRLCVWQPPAELAASSTEKFPAAVKAVGTCAVFVPGLLR